MAIPHLRAGQPVDVQALGDQLAGSRTHALFKSEQLELMRLVLRAGKSLPPHQVAGEITIQCIEGEIEVTLGEAAHRLGAGQLLYLPGGAVHGVRALSDASALVTLVLNQPPSSPNP